MQAGTSHLRDRDWSGRKKLLTSKQPKPEA